MLFLAPNAHFLPDAKTPLPCLSKRSQNIKKAAALFFPAERLRYFLNRSKSSSNACASGEIVTILLCRRANELEMPETFEF